MVTGRTGSDEVVAGLEAGADDYVTKPVAARVEAVLRRTDPHRIERLVVGDLELQAHEGTVRRAGRQLHLSRTELHLLAALAGQAGQPAPAAAAAPGVGYDYFGDPRLLDVHVRRLRAKVEDDPADPA